MKQRALVIGIDYEATPDARLRGCQNDALRARDYLVDARGYPKEAVKVCLDRDSSCAEGTTKAGIIEGILRLATASNREEDLEEVYLHFSGHGTQPRGGGGSDEDDGLDEALVPSDFRVNGVLRDDKLNSLLQEFHPRTRVLCVFDCCHSGTMLDLPWKYRCPKVYTGSASVERLRHGSGAETPARVLCLSGCRDDQVSMDAYNVSGRGRYSGAMTSHLTRVLGTRPDGRVPLRDLFADLHRSLRDDGFDQRPVLTSSVDLDLENALF